MGKLKKGYVQVYTGNGKGKTTAAVGLAVRAAGDGYRVYMLQFLKGGNTGELEIAKLLSPNFQIFRFEKPRGFVWTLNEEEKAQLKDEIQKGYDFALKVIRNRECDILIIDEIMATLYNNFLTEKDVIKLIDEKPEDMEIILTGRNVPESLVERADLVTEMKDIKHYFNQGVMAREGIEY